MKEIIELLGEENSQKLKDGIINIILDRVREDINEYESYVVEPDEIYDIVRKRTKEKIEKIVDSKTGELENIVDNMFGNVRKNIEPRPYIKLNKI